MRGTDPFGSYKSRTLRCKQGRAYINPEYELRRVEDLELGDGIPIRRFARWYRGLRTEIDAAISPKPHGNPRLVRGLRVVIVRPIGEQEQ